MPKKLERELKKKTRKLFGSTKSERPGAYMYSTMRKAGWKPKREK